MVLLASQMNVYSGRCDVNYINRMSKSGKSNLEVSKSGEKWKKMSNQKIILLTQ